VLALIYLPENANTIQFVLRWESSRTGDFYFGLNLLIFLTEMLFLNILRLQDWVQMKSFLFLKGKSDHQDGLMGASLSVHPGRRIKIRLCFFPLKYYIISSHKSWISPFSVKRRGRLPSTAFVHFLGVLWNRYPVLWEDVKLNIWDTLQKTLETQEVFLFFFIVLIFNDLGKVIQSIETERGSCKISKVGKPEFQINISLLLGSAHSIHKIVRHA
jgi:hypothetical protein